MPSPLFVSDKAGNCVQPVETESAPREAVFTRATRLGGEINDGVLCAVCDVALCDLFLVASRNLPTKRLQTGRVKSLEPEGAAYLSMAVIASASSRETIPISIR